MSKQTNNTKESRNWYKDRYQAIMLQRRLFMIITIISMISTLMAMIVIANITPLKGVEPFLIQVDAKSGITQLVDPLTVKDITGLEAVNNFFIVQYIRSRESYHSKDVTRNYATVRVMSVPDPVYAKFRREANPSNPQSVAARMGAAGLRSVKFKSIIYPKPNQAQARLLIEETAANGGTLQYHKIATLVFDYVKLDLTNEERYINPLGFRVTDYRVDEDALPK
jgi:type IV secretion system protein VirB8